jgi:predicted patatin/cPLA2 family phospholipase
MSAPLTSPNKLAIVCAGGGMSCTYAGGAIVALADEGKIYSKSQA